MSALRARRRTEALVACELERAHEVAVTAIAAPAAGAEAFATGMGRTCAASVWTISPDGFDPRSARAAAVLDRDRLLQPAREGSWTRGCCAVRNCPHKALPYVPFCTGHILLEKSQRLYERCVTLGPGGRRCPHPVTNRAGMASFCAACSERSLRAAADAAAVGFAAAAVSHDGAAHLYGRLDPREPLPRGMNPRELAATYSNIHRLVGAIQSQRRELRNRALELRYRHEPQ